MIFFQLLFIVVASVLIGHAIDEIITGLIKYYRLIKANRNRYAALASCTDVETGRAKDVESFSSDLSLSKTRFNKKHRHGLRAENNLSTSIK
tara:strand:- start:9795 stop:10070 length:276 start_codon:yes stop_codon:yes gene_type:complete